MKKKFLAVFATALVMFGMVGIANATPIELDWTTTVNLLYGSVSSVGTVGEEITTTLTVDNGGSTTLSQSWSATDFLSYRIEGATGWWAESTVVINGSSSGNFSTDGSGNVTAAGDWSGNSGVITTSWAGDLVGCWYSDANNGIFYINPPSDSGMIEVANVGENIIGSNWTATLASSNPVPEPATMVLFGFGILGLAGVSRKKK